MTLWLGRSHNPNAWRTAHVQDTLGEHRFRAPQWILQRPAVEDRIKACAPTAPGLYFQQSLSEVDQLNFVYHVKAPVLMLNGRFDFFYLGRPRRSLCSASLAPRTVRLAGPLFGTARLLESYQAGKL